MSGMFQRIARRHPDRADEPGAAETAGAEDLSAGAANADPAAPEAPAATNADPAAPEAPAADTPTTASSATPAADAAPDAPTERIDPVPPASDAAPGEQPTTYQPAVQPPPAAQDAPPSGAAPPGAAPPSDPAPATEDASAAAPTDDAAAEPEPRRPGFRARGRMRRRLRYLRKLRELQVRDLGGLVFDLRRFERKRDDLVAQKIDHIRACDDELRALETALGERRDLRDVREPGIGGTCPRCFAVYGSADRFCSNCGAALGGAVQGPAQVPIAPPQARDSST